MFVDVDILFWHVSFIGLLLSFTCRIRLNYLGVLLLSCASWCCVIVITCLLRLVTVITCLVMLCGCYHKPCDVVLLFSCNISFWVPFSYDCWYWGTVSIYLLPLECCFQLHVGVFLRLLVLSICCVFVHVWVVVYTSWMSIFGRARLSVYVTF